MNGSTPIRRSDVLAAPPVRGGAPTDAQLSALRFFSVSRVIVALMLLLFAGLNDQLAVFESPASRQKFTHITQFYLLLAVAWLVAAPVLRRYFQPLLVAQVMTDLLLLTLLVHYAGGQRSGLGVLLVAAVAGASVLSTTALAGFFAAMAALLLLTETGWQAIGGDPADPSAFFRAGLIGAAGFVTAYVVNWLGVRLDRQEWLTRQRDADLRNQLAITQLVVAELQQGVLVVDDDGSVRTMNRAAQALLGAPSHTGPSLLAAGGDGPWSRIGRAYRDWHGGGLPPPEAVFFAWRLNLPAAAGKAAVCRAPRRSRWIWGRSRQAAATIGCACASCTRRPPRAIRCWCWCWRICAASRNARNS